VLKKKKLPFEQRQELCIKAREGYRKQIGILEKNREELQKE
jgi:hypothetical protein